MPPKCYGDRCSPLGAACPVAAKTAVATMRRDMIGNQTAGSNEDSSAFLYACHTHCGQYVLLCYAVLPDSMLPYTFSLLGTLSVGPSTVRRNSYCAYSILPVGYNCRSVLAPTTY
jgi:hypothetical protein